jgi:solute carrier family 25 (mitochondrial S-adenosylmethionine transporter), member 26
MQMSQFKTAHDASRVIVAKEGIKGLFAVCLLIMLYQYKLYCIALSFHTHVSVVQGYGSFLLRDLPFDAIQFCIYEQLRIGYKLAVFIQFMLDKSHILFARTPGYCPFC